MKIDENLWVNSRRRLKKYHIIVYLIRMVYVPAYARHEQANLIMIFNSHQFSPGGRVRDVHLPRYQCLANERLEHVKYAGCHEFCMKGIM